MKKRIWLCCLLALCALFLAGCGANPAGTQLPASTPSSETAAGEDTFTSEDMKTFTFEGTEYTFPLSYDVLTEQGWTVSDYSYELFSNPQEVIGKPEGEKLETCFLRMQNEKYAGIDMEIEIFGWSDPNRALGSVEELVDEFEANGVWGINIFPSDDATDAPAFPDLSFRGVTFGSSAEDIVEAFGTDYDSTFGENSYGYFVMDTGTTSFYSLRFETENNAVYSISATIG